MSSSSSGGILARRAALTVAVIGLVGGAAVASTLGAGSRPVSRRSQPRWSSLPVVPASTASPSPYGGEPELPRGSSVPRIVWRAAVGFVRDYEAWSAGRLAAIPRGDATARMIRVLGRAGRLGGRFSPSEVGSVRIAPAGIQRYVVTSVVGNFLVGRSGSRWLVISLPGD